MASTSASSSNADGVDRLRRPALPAASKGSTITSDEVTGGPRSNGRDARRPEMSPLIEPPWREIWIVSIVGVIQNYRICLQFIEMYNYIFYGIFVSG